MKILMPFWNMGIFPRYIPQLKAISEHCEKFNIAYTKGEPNPNWPKCFTFHKVDLKEYVNKSLNWILSREHVAEQLESVDYDLTYCVSGREGQYYASYLAKYAGVPHVIRLRGELETVDNLVTPGRLKRLFLTEIYRESFTSAAMVIPITEKLRGEAIKYGAKNISDPIPNGVDLNKFHPEDVNHKYRALYVGRISPEKGTQFLIKLMEKTPDIKYGVAGSIQSKWDPPDNCETLGQIPYSEIQKIYNLTDFLLLPSISEGIPNTLFEAYASCLPVIGTPDAIPQEIKVYGFRVRQDVETWAKLLRRIKWFNLAEMGAQARQYVERFSWEAYSDNMHRLLSAIANHEPIPAPEFEVRA